MNFREICSSNFNVPVVAAGFIPQSGDVKIWAALRDGELCFLSPSLGVQKQCDLGLIPLNDAFPFGSENLIVGIGGRGIRIYDGKQDDVFNPCPHFSDHLYKAAPYSDTAIICGGSDEVLRTVDLSNCQMEELAEFGEALYSVWLHPHSGAILYSSASGEGCYSAIIQPDGERRMLSEFFLQKTASTFDLSGTRTFEFNKHVFCNSYPSLEHLWCFSENDGFTESKDEEDWERAYAWSNPIFLPNSNRMICGSYSGKIHCWDWDTPELISSIQAHKGRVLHLALDSVGQQLISTGDDKSIKLWQLDN